MPGGPGGFTQNSTCSVLLRILLAIVKISFTGLSPSMAPLSRGFYYLSFRILKSYNPSVQAQRFGLIPFRSPLLRESLSLSFPPGTEMFHFPGLAPFRVTEHLPLPGYPIRTSAGHSSFPANRSFSQVVASFIAS